MAPPDRPLAVERRTWVQVQDEVAQLEGWVVENPGVVAVLLDRLQQGQRRLAAAQMARMGATTAADMDTAIDDQLAIDARLHEIRTECERLALPAQQLLALRSLLVVRMACGPCSLTLEMTRAISYRVTE